MMTRTLRWVSLGSVPAAVGLTCCGTGDAPFDQGGGAAPGSGHAASGSGGMLLNPATGSATSANGSGGIENTCVGTSSKAQLTPLDMYVMMDQSGSMNDPASGGKSKWQNVVAAFQTFVSLPAAAGIGVGIQYFPFVPSCSVDADCGMGQPCFSGKCVFSMSQCDSAKYETPELEIVPLPGGTSALLASLDARVPFGSTPSYAALKGAIGHATKWQAANPTHATIVVLATDGEPEAPCKPQDIPSVAAVAAAGATANPPILTFVIGVGKNLSSLNAWAAAGGTNQAFIVDINQDAAQQFAQALQDIQKQALSCEYLIPTPANGQIDYQQVNVKYSPSGSAAKLIPQVASLKSCGAAGGWYYVPPAAPKKIVMCPSTCKALKADTSGKVDIVLGCKTIAM